MKKLHLLLELAKYLVGLVVSGIIFSGCANTYNVEPVYKDKDKVVMIDSLKFENVVFYRKKNRKLNTRSMGNIKQYREEFKLDNKKCNKLTAEVYTALNSWYFHNSRLEDIMKYYNNKCDVEKVENLNFVTCYKTKMITDDNGIETEKEFQDYGITMSSTNQYGYGKKISVDLFNKDCYEEVKEYFQHNVTTKE